MKTKTYTYAFSFSDKKMTLGLMKDTRKDEQGNEIELDYYIPKTFRVKEDATKDKDSTKVVRITLILSKTHVKGKYNKIHYGDENEITLLPDRIKNLIDENIILSNLAEKR